MKPKFKDLRVGAWFTLMEDHPSGIKNSLIKMRRGTGSKSIYYAHQFGGIDIELDPETEVEIDWSMKQPEEGKSDTFWSEWMLEKELKKEETTKQENRAKVWAVINFFLLMTMFGLIFYFLIDPDNHHRYPFKTSSQTDLDWFLSQSMNHLGPYDSGPAWEQFRWLMGFEDGSWPVMLAMLIFVVLIFTSPVMRLLIIGFAVIHYGGRVLHKIFGSDK